MRVTQCSLAAGPSVTFTGAIAALKAHGNITSTCQDMWTENSQSYRLYHLGHGPSVRENIFGAHSYRESEDDRYHKTRDYQLGAYTER